MELRSAARSSWLSGIGVHPVAVSGRRMARHRFGRRPEQAFVGAEAGAERPAARALLRLRPDERHERGQAFDERLKRGRGMAIPVRCHPGAHLEQVSLSRILDQPESARSRRILGGSSASCLSPRPRSAGASSAVEIAPALEGAPRHRAHRHQRGVEHDQAAGRAVGLRALRSKPMRRWRTCIGALDDPVERAAVEQLGVALGCLEGGVEDARRLAGLLALGGARVCQSASSSMEPAPTQSLMRCSVTAFSPTA